MEGVILETFVLERDKFNLFGDEVCISVKELSTAFTDNFDVPYDRCAYMYRYAPCHFLFYKECMSRFFSQYENSKNLIEGWGSKSNICSLSIGPGLDYLAFSSAILEVEKKLPCPVFQNVHILSEYGAWRNTVNLLSETIRKAKISKKVNKSINFNQVIVWQVDIYEKLRENAISVLKNSDVLLMFKLLNLTSEEDEDTFAALSNLALQFKPGVTIFFTDTMPSCLLMKKVLSRFDGKYLYGPLRENSIVSYQYPKEYVEIVGTNPVKSARGVFFVWKRYTSQAEISNNITTKNKISQGTCSSGAIHSTSVHMTNTKSGLSSNAITKNEYIKPYTTSNGLVVCSKNENWLINPASEWREREDSKKLSFKNKKITALYDFPTNEKQFKSIAVETMPVSKPEMESECTQTDPEPFIWSSNQLAIFGLLNSKINKLASSIDKNLVPFCQADIKKNTATSKLFQKLNAIEQSTNKINKMISSIEKGLNIKTQITKDEKTVNDLIDF